MWWFDNGMHGWDAWWGYPLMTVSMVVFWGLVVFGAITLARRNRSAPARPDAEQVLAERFARGEIDEHEYHQRLDTLHGGPRPLVKP